MTALARDSRVGVVGAGAMGSGIAQVAATYGHQVVLHDTSSVALQRATSGIEKNLARSVEKGRLTAEEASAVSGRISVTGESSGSQSGARHSGDTNDESVAAFEGCALVIEAVMEELEVKRDLFARLEQVLGVDAILGTNTSSLSVTAIARGCKRPERVIGIHFFNPPAVLPLVEIIPGLVTAAEVTSATRSLVDAWGKTTVLASDTPGFIVNRIARPFYGEALRIYEERIADMATIDWAMRELGGFRMGPFELMDFIGNDINFAATRAVFEGTFFDPRYKPFLTQQRLFEAGFFGQKTGRGYYDYGAHAKPPEPTRDMAVGTKIFYRVLAMLINEAADAVFFGIASAEDVELAMTKGVNYPKGLLQWADEIGIGAVLATLESLQAEYGEDRYRPSPLLRRMASDGMTFSVTSG